MASLSILISSCLMTAGLLRLLATPLHTVRAMLLPFSMLVLGVLSGFVPTPFACYVAGNCTIFDQGGIKSPIGIYSWLDSNRSDISWGAEGTRPLSYSNWT